MSDDLMKRPTVADEYVCRRAAEIIFPEVWRWLGRKNSWSSEADVMRHLMKIARTNSNGYDLSKALERLGWPADGYLVETLDETGSSRPSKNSPANGSAA